MRSFREMGSTDVYMTGSASGCFRPNMAVEPMRATLLPPTADVYSVMMPWPTINKRELYRTRDFHMYAGWADLGTALPGDAE